MSTLAPPSASAPSASRSNAPSVSKTKPAAPVIRINPKKKTFAVSAKRASLVAPTSAKKATFVIGKKTGDHVTAVDELTEFDVPSDPLPTIVTIKPPDKRRAAKQNVALPESKSTVFKIGQGSNSTITPPASNLPVARALSPRSDHPMLPSPSPLAPKSSDFEGNDNLEETLEGETFDQDLNEKFLAPEDMLVRTATRPATSRYVVYALSALVVVCAGVFIHTHPACYKQSTASVLTDYLVFFLLSVLAWEPLLAALNWKWDKKTFPEGMKVQLHKNSGSSEGHRRTSISLSYSGNTRASYAPSGSFEGGSEGNVTKKGSVSGLFTEDR